MENPRYFYCLHCSCIVSETDLLPDDRDDQACPMSTCTGAGIGVDLHNIEEDFAKGIVKRQRRKGRDCKAQPLVPSEKEMWPSKKGFGWYSHRAYIRGQIQDQKTQCAKKRAQRKQHGIGHKNK